MITSRCHFKKFVVNVNIWVGPGTASSSVASPYGSDPSCVGMAMAAPPPYPDSVQQVSLMPYPSSLPAVPSVGSPQGYVDCQLTVESRTVWLKMASSLRVRRKQMTF